MKHQLTLSHEEKREREEGGLLYRGFILHNKTNKQTHIDKAYNTGLTLQTRAGIHTMVGDYIHINGRKIEVWLMIKNIYIYIYLYLYMSMI